VWEQGKGIINNLGALRTKPFEEWGFYNKDTWEVHNWDGTLSPVVHQFDRDKHLVSLKNTIALFCLHLLLIALTLYSQHNHIVREVFNQLQKDFLSKDRQ
jgi:hypothetical protein